ncbi:MAG: hypothetical protein JWP28_2689 [Phenylobacterium sp.]|jgi:uncharacterized membrane protein|uniref:DUF1700 domain-containing protein n=1 Tax=Phenylobacterium sp. TaxID=1871053 RepID=UPI00261A4638|nr:DUF1700 domain-containing protein [Phenylobacterium sp.]MDB5428326.1 hypothetical protein [Phenylobacterium sp.]MDB5498658.1 hypothetical protein [Phenylobacterium sp.]
MTRQAFMARLREGLRGLPPSAVADIVADYENHFNEGEAAGRSEADVATALGDPGRLARELRAEKGLKRWEEERSASAGAGAVFAVLGLGAIDILFLLPILMGVGGAMFGVAVAVIAVFFAGGVVFAAGPFTGLPGGPAAAVLAGIGLMAGATAVGAVLAICTIGLVNALVWYGRLHYRLLKPALEPQAAGGVQ